LGSVEWLSGIIKSLVGFEPQLGDFSRPLHGFSEPEWVSRIPSYLLADPGCSFQNPTAIYPRTSELSRRSIISATD
jgi:hypothetical protein